MRSPRLSELKIEPPTERALAWLAQMRGANYAKKYLRSSLWLNHIRPAVLKRDGHRCVVCRRYSRLVHHLSYDPATMLGHNLDKLKTVCPNHHDSAHFGNPALEDEHLSQRFTEVHEEHRIGMRRRSDLVAKGGRLLFRITEKKAWTNVSLEWRFAPAHRDSARNANVFFFLGAARGLRLEYHRRLDAERGTKLRTAAGKHVATFHLEQYQLAPGLLKLRREEFPDILATLLALTSEHPFPVAIARAEDGVVIGRSGKNNGNAKLVPQPTPAGAVT